MTALLTVDDLYAGYGDTEVLHGIDLRVSGGEIVSLLGRNGVGKTTTLLSILGRVKPRSGEVRFDGRNITGMSPADTAQLGIGLVPEGRRIFPGLTVEENLRVSRFGGAQQTDGYSIDEIYDVFERLEERKAFQGSALSGGEQQMLSIARSLVAGVKVLMLDEPTEGLAPAIVQKVKAIITELNEQGITLVVVEQNVDIALQLADRNYFLENGQVVHETAHADIDDDEELLRQYLGVTKSSE